MARNVSKFEQAALRTARTENWPWCNPRTDETFCGDNLIAMAVGCRRQRSAQTAGLTAEDAKIIYRRAPLVAVDAAGHYCSFSNDLNTLRYIVSLNL